MKSFMKKCVISIFGLGFLGGCVVYEPRPRVYAYDYYDGPAVVYVHGGYYGHGYYYRR